MDKYKKIAHCLIALAVLCGNSFHGYPLLAQEELQEQAAGTTPEALIGTGGILLRKGQFQIEPCFLYSYFSKNRIVISGFSIYEAVLVGRIYAEDAEREILDTNLAMRYGLSNNTELELNVPFRYRQDEVTVIATNEAATNDGAGLGDVEAAIYRQLIYEHGNIPDIVLNLKVKSRTGEDPYGLASDEVPIGTGHWGVKTGLTFSKTNDPVILFGTLGYYWNLERDVVGETWNPGDAIEYGVGLAYALNPQISLNTRLEHRLTGKAKSNGVSVARSDLNVATLYTGFGYALSKNSSLNLTVGVGLTEDAPKFVLQVRLPYTF